MFKVVLGDKVFNLTEKTPILNLLEKEEIKKYCVAKVNNRLRELTYELCFDCCVELLDTSTYDAVKVYETSLRYLLAMAYHNIYPDYKIRISYNISRSILVSILKPNNIIVDNKMIKSLKNELTRLIELDIPFEKFSLSKEEARKIYQANNQ